MKSNTKDFTEGNIWGQMLTFSVPLMFTNLLQILFNMTDIAVVGRFSGSLALGSVGSTATLVTLFTGMLIGMAGGINVLVAHSIGARNERDVREYVHTAVLISLMLGLLICGLGHIFAKNIMELMNTKPELIDGAVLYLKIYFLGMPALALYNYGNAVLSAAGDTKRPLKYLTLSGVINVVLNLIFVVGLEMNVAGVALASIISQYISAVLIIRALVTSKEAYRLDFKNIRLYPGKVSQILAIGLPSAMQNAIFHFANLFVQVGVNHFDATMVSGNSAAANADGIVYDVMAAFYTAGASFIGQNYGAGKKKRILKSYFVSMAYSFGIGLVLGVTLIIFGEQFLSIFTTESAVVDAGMKRLSIMGLSYAFSAFMDATIAASRGLGRGVVPTIIVIMGSCVFRVIWIYTIFAFFETIESLYLLYIFSWSITAIAEVIYFAYVYKKTV